MLCTRVNMISIIAQYYPPSCACTRVRCSYVYNHEQTKQIPKWRTNKNKLNTTHSIVQLTKQTMHQNWCCSVALNINLNLCCHSCVWVLLLHGSSIYRFLVAIYRRYNVVIRLLFKLILPPDEGAQILNKVQSCRLTVTTY